MLRTFCKYLHLKLPRLCGFGSHHKSLCREDKPTSALRRLRYAISAGVYPQFSSKLFMTVFFTNVCSLTLTDLL